MKIYVISGLALTLAIISGCGPTQLDGSPEKLKAAVLGYFEGIENKDTAKMLSVTTSDFMLYEDGRIWSNDSVFMNIRQHLPFTVKYKPHNFKVNVDTHSGYMTYTNHADFVFKNSQKVVLDWIESATFIKEGGVWKMNFLGATVRKR